MTPEEEARVEIDEQLKACGWDVQDKDQANLSAARGCQEDRASDVRCRGLRSTRSPSFWYPLPPSYWCPSLKTDCAQSA